MAVAFPCFIFSVLAVLDLSTGTPVQPNVPTHAYLRGAPNLLKLTRKSAIFEDMVTVATYYLPKSLIDGAEGATGLTEVYPARRRLSEWYNGCVKRVLVTYVEVINFLQEHAHVVAKEVDSLMSKDAEEELLQMFEEDKPEEYNTNVEWLSIEEDDVSPGVAGESSSFLEDYYTDDFEINFEWESYQEPRSSLLDSNSLSFMSHGSYEDGWRSDQDTQLPSAKELDAYESAPKNSATEFSSLENAE